MPHQDGFERILITTLKGTEESLHARVSNTYATANVIIAKDCSE